MQGQLAAHQAHQPLADGQPQPRAAEPPRGRGLGLREAFEDALLVLGRDADAGVRHGEGHAHRVVAARGHADADHHLAFGRELDGIAAQVDQHLLQAQDVADQAARQRGVDLEQHLDGLVGGTGGEDRAQPPDELVRVEGLRVQQHLSGFDLREVQDVVEQPQQRTRRAFGLAGIVALACRQRGLVQQRQHAQDGIHRRADLVAHVGQEVALGLGGLLGDVARPHEVGDVDAEAHQVAIGQVALDDLQHATVAEGLDQLAVALAVRGHAFGHPLVDTADGGLVLAAQRAATDDVLEACSRDDQVAADRVDAAVFLVAVDQPVLRVEQHEGLVDRVDGAAQQRVGALDVGDVGVGGDHAAAGQRTADHLERPAVGPHTFEPMRLDRAAHGGHHTVAEPDHHGIRVLAALPVEVNEILVSRWPLGLEQGVGQIEQFAELGVADDQAQLAVEDAEAAGQVFDDAGEQVVASHQLAFQRAQLRDLEAHADHAQRRLARGRHHLAGRTQRLAAAVTGGHAVLLLEALALEDRAVQGVLQAAAVRRVDAGEPLGQVDGVARRRQVVQAARLRVPAELAVRPVQLPHADARGLRGDLEAFARHAQRHFLALAACDVRAQRQVALDASVRSLDRRHDAVDPVQAAVAGAVADLALPGVAARDGLPHLRPEGRRVQAGAHDAVRLADQRLAAVAAEGAEGVVDLGDRAVGQGHRDDRVRMDGVQQRLVQPLGIAQLAAGPHALADVGFDGDVAAEAPLIVQQGLDLVRDDVVATLG